GAGNQLKGVYTLQPHADPSRIRWRYDGGDEVTIDSSGNLIVTARSPEDDRPALTLTEHAPLAWQEIAGQRKAVDVRYKVEADESISVVLGEYDAAGQLIIDPAITYSTFLGGAGADISYGIALD